jgi:hypothetical protein
METVEQRYERLMGEKTLEEFIRHLEDSSLPYTKTVRHPIDKQPFIVITPKDTNLKERRFGRDKKQIQSKDAN